jgi:hypothetical protein
MFSLFRFYLIFQVMEAVCILLGVKADWNTAKVMLADPSLISKVNGVFS